MGLEINKISEKFSKVKLLLFDATRNLSIKLSTLSSTPKIAYLKKSGQ